MRDQFRFFPWNYRGDDARLAIPFPPPERLHLVAMDFLQAGDGYRTGYAAAFRHDTEAALAQLDVPIVAVAREDDLLFSHLDRMPKLPDGSRIVQLAADRDAWGKALRDIFLAYTGESAPAHAETHVVSGKPARLFNRNGSRATLVRAIAAGGGRPLVLLHHSPGGSSDFVDLMLRLDGKRPVYAIDLPGHGDSDGLGARATLADHAAAIGDTLDALGPRRHRSCRRWHRRRRRSRHVHGNPARYHTVTVANLPLRRCVTPAVFRDRSLW